MQNYIYLIPSGWVINHMLQRQLVCQLPHLWANTIVSFSSFYHIVFQYLFLFFGEDTGFRIVSRLRLF